MPARSVAGSMLGCSVALSAGFSQASIDSIGHLLRAAELSQRHSLRSLHQLSRLAEIEADKQLRFAEKQAAREEHERAWEDVQEQLRQQRAHEAAHAEAHRKARAEAAARAEEELKEAARRKVQAVDNRLDEFEAERQEIARRANLRAARAEARRQATLQASIDAATARRSRYVARQAAAERALREREELRQLDIQIRDEQAFLREEARKEARTRADAELQGRTTRYVQKGRAKEQALSDWQRRSQAVRKLRAQEARARAEHIAVQTREAAEADNAKRAIYRSQVEAKSTRVDLINSERNALARQIGDMRHSMLMQERSLRESLILLQQRGRAFKLPASVAASLQDYPASVARSTSTMQRSASLSQAARRSSGGGRRRAMSARPGPTFSPAAAGAGPMGAKTGGGPKRVRPMTASAVLRAEQQEARAHMGTTPIAEGPAAQPQSAAAQQLPPAGGAAGAAREGLEGELRRVLREEIDKEAERQAILTGMTDATEAARLSTIFAAERSEAKARILALSAALHSAASPVTAAPRPAPALAASPAQLSTSKPVAPAASTCAKVTASVMQVPPGGVAVQVA